MEKNPLATKPKESIANWPLKKKTNWAGCSNVRKSYVLYGQKHHTCHSPLHVPSLRQKNLVGNSKQNTSQVTRSAYSDSDLTRTWRRLCEWIYSACIPFTDREQLISIENE